jgi:hypothetical protein
MFFINRRKGKVVMELLREYQGDFGREKGESFHPRQKSKTEKPPLISGLSKWVMKSHKWRIEKSHSALI